MMIILILCTITSLAVLFCSIAGAKSEVETDEIILKEIESLKKGNRNV